MTGQALPHGLRPIFDHFVRAEGILAALQARDRRETGTRHRLLLRSTHSAAQQGDHH